MKLSKDVVTKTLLNYFTDELAQTLMKEMIEAQEERDYIEEICKEDDEA